MTDYQDFVERMLPPLRVFPTAEKRPRVGSWKTDTTWAHDCEPAPELGVQIPYGYSVLDIDDPTMVPTVIRAVNLLGGCEWATRTPSGGAHFWLKHGTADTVYHGQGEKYDWRGCDKGYVLAPGSITSKGDYTTLEGCLLSERTSTGVGAKQATAEAFAKYFPVTGSGEGSGFNRMTEASYHAADDLQKRFGVSLTEGRTQFSGPCPECGGEDRFWLTEFEDSPGQVRMRCRKCCPKGFDLQDRLMAQTLMQLPAPPKEVSSDDQWWVELRDPGSFPPAVGVVTTAEGRILVAEGKHTDLFAGMASGKSWAALLAARQAISDGRRVIYCDAEMGPDDISVRSAVLNCPEIRDSDQFRYMEGSPSKKNSPVLFAKAINWVLEGERSGLVIFDTVGSLGGHTNDAKDYTGFAADCIFPWKKNGIAVLTLDHDVKSAEARAGQVQRSAIGSAAKGNIPDIVLWMTQANFTDELPGESIIYKSKDRGSVISQVAPGQRCAKLIVRQDNGPQFSLESASEDDVARTEDRVTFDHIGEAIADYFTNEITGSVSQSRILEHINFRDSDIREKLNLMVEAGELGRDVGGPGKPTLYWWIDPVLRQAPQAADALDDIGENIFE